MQRRGIHGFAVVPLWLALVGCSADVAVGMTDRADAAFVLDAAMLADATCPDGTLAVDCAGDCSAVCVAAEPPCGGLCDDGNPCTTDGCGPAGVCTSTAHANPCDDGDGCTIGDVCAKGACLPGAATACDDDNPCTTDACAKGSCSHAAGGGACEDGNACTIGDHCAQANCQPGGAKPCGDNDPCTIDACNPLNGCSYAPSTAACDDGDACSDGDSCAGGKCSPGKGNPCDDKNVCTQDTCASPGPKCSYQSSTGLCDDGNACTESDTCTWLGGSAPACIGLLKACDDGNPCSVDSCVPGSGCKTIAKPEKTPCSDGDACTTGDACNHDGLCVGLATVCDDGNPCTVDACAKLTGLCAHEAGNGGPCEDGNSCTLGDACVQGGCVSGNAKLCGDGNPCTKDQCLVNTGTCVFTVWTGACDDGNSCTSGDQCAGGVCVAGTLPGCDDANGCTADACLAAKGGCAHVPMNDGVACQDGEACTQGDLCSAGACEPGPWAQCDDGNACSQNGCDAKTGGCVFTPLDATPCSDGDGCTAGDACMKGKCVAGAVACECQKDSECAKLEDGDACNGKLFCDLADHKCKLDAKTVVSCDPTQDNACVTWTCDKVAGECKPANVNEGGACNADGSVCSETDHCQAGVCMAGTTSGCDDGNACTNDACDPVLGCQHAANALSCSDGDPCTLSDLCSKGKCASGQKKVCDDGNTCTGDVCQGGTCVSSPLSGTACTDGNPCTVNDTCTLGSCLPGGPKACLGTGACTVGVCDGATGQCSVKTAGDGTSCSDGVACTLGDHCESGSCVGGAPTCLSESPCLVGKCNVTSGKCDFLPSNDGGGCKDANPCTVQDKCKDGACLGGPAQACPDGQPCTFAACDQVTGGCVPKPDGLPCSDGSACTLKDHCVNGACLFEAYVQCDDKNQCTNDICDQPTGNCSFQSTAGECDDGNKCTTAESCGTGKCVATGKLDCDDKNDCTKDSCDPGSGCSHVLVTSGPCDDDNACTTADKCTAKGECEGTGLTCAHDDPCIVATCAPKTGCKFTPSPGPCDDENGCTKNDKCVSGKCIPGPPVSCSDGNPCVDDSCDPKDGSCIHIPNSTGKCSDNDSCTAGDHCDNGACLGGVGQTACDDGNPCTVDQCLPSGCVYAPSTAAACTDGNACTDKDVCIEGVCISGVPLNCGDGNACTDDACAPGPGCVYKNNPGKCDDGNACDGADLCGGGVCKGSVAFNCDDGQTCTTDSCDPQTGCLYVPVGPGKACNDGNPCTISDTCKNGICAGSAVINCNDGNYCTLDSCSLTAGCAHKLQVGASCDDGDSCTSGDACDGAGACQPGKTGACDDGNPCTIDSCDKKTGCKQMVGSTGQGIAIVVPGDTQVVAAEAGSGAKAAVATWDQYPGWTHTIAGATWLWSTQLVQKPEQQTQVAFSRTFAIPAGLGALVGHLLVATDGAFVCTLNGKLVGVSTVEQNWKQPFDQPLSGKLKNGQNVLVCTVVNPGKIGSSAQTNPAGILFKIDSMLFDSAGALSCNDGNACTVSDWCKGAVCQAGGIVSCDDSNACTFDACDAKLGCAHIPSGQLACSDGNSCTTGDTCAGSTCKAGPPANCDDINACTADSCVPASGCVHTALAGKACEDGNVCTIQDSCAGSVCKPGVANPCGDGNTCTIDKCEPVSGCFYAQSSGGSACNDGNACTTGDSCSGATCLGAKATVCVDGNACTADGCNPQTGCVYPAVSGPCEDGSACTLQDSCSGGKCVGGVAKGCSDTDPCTLDLCDAKTGACSFAPSSAGPCQDGNLCTLQDSCLAGKCQPGATRNCDDANPCTVDGCNPGSGDCTHAAAQAGYACNDSNSCTENDVCGTKGCAGVAKACAVGKVCLAGVCQ